MTGAKVSKPTVRSTVRILTPALFKSDKSFGVKCKPAVGAAADAGRFA